jgi:CRP/FNR family transcriptional regulator, anaerobic regulatory protein
VSHRLVTRPEPELRTGVTPALVAAGHASASRASGCGACRLASQCLPSSLNGAGSELLERIAQQTRLLEKGAILQQTDSAFENLYVVQVGALKGITHDGGGSESIARFYLPGEIVGLDAIDRIRFSLKVVALETSAVCRIPYRVFQTLAITAPSLMEWLLGRISAEIRNEQYTRVALASGNAAQVLARALIDLGQRFARGGLSATRLRLPMTRCELGNSLGLTPETMSRLFRRFARQRLVAAVGREIELLDIDGLRRLGENRSALASTHHAGSIARVRQDRSPIYVARQT